MQRNLQDLSTREFDLCVVGGGISGASVAWDAAARGLSVALVEKQDFGHATSSATSKLAHGGLRYLKNAEFGLVRESLRERRILEFIAPHLVYPLPFMVPTYKHSSNSYLPIKIGMMMYDALSFDKAHLDDPDRRIPSHRSYSPREILKLEPGVKQEGLTGGAVYYDCQMLSPDRLTLAFIRSAVGKGAVVANYAQAEGFLMQGNRIMGVKVKDRIGGGTYEIRAKVTANVAGPWADIVLGLTQHKTDKRLIRSQGIHIITRLINKENALVLMTQGKRHFFIIPWRGHSLIGTTDTKFEGDPDDYRVTEKAVEEFISEINWSYPSGALKRDDVLLAYGGLRPIVERETKVNVYNASRKYEIYDNAKDEKLEGLVTVIGGKYTTSRHLAEQLVDMVFAKLCKAPPASVTKTIRLHGGDIANWKDFLAEAQRNRPSNLDSTVIEYLASHYGTVCRDVLKIAEKDQALAQRLPGRRQDIAAQVVYAVKEEMAIRLEDFVFRRSGFGTLGDPGPGSIERCAELMSGLLGWNEARKSEEIKAVRHVLDRQGITG